MNKSRLAIVYRQFCSFSKKHTPTAEHSLQVSVTLTHDGSFSPTAELTIGGGGEGADDAHLLYNQAEALFHPFDLECHGEEDYEGHPFYEGTWAVKIQLTDLIDME